MDFNELKAIGFTQGEITVFSAVLNSGISTIGVIHEKTGLERRAIYDILNKLIKKGFISYTFEGGKRSFVCASPSILKEEVRARIAKLKKIESSIPEMEIIYKSKKPKINFQTFRGEQGIISVFEDMLNYKRNYFIGGGGYVLDKLPFFWKSYNKRRIKAGIVWYNLAREELRGHKITKERLMRTKFLPKEFSGSPNVIWIYGDKIANVLWSKDFFAFVIESKEIAENYNRYFRYLWDNVAKK